MYTVLNHAIGNNNDNNNNNYYYYDNNYYYNYNCKKRVLWFT